MNKEVILEALQIRYVDLTFSLTMLENAMLPRNKASMLRGGMGQMLLSQNCIRDQHCEVCDFESECLVRRMMYSKFEIQPKFASRGDSIGYVIECENDKEHFRRGEQLEFHLLLYGKTIAYFTQFFQAFFMLGQQGIGKEKSRFIISKVINEKGELVADDHNICIQKLGIRTVADYVKERKMQIEKKNCKAIMIFKTPVTLKYQGEFITQFHEEAIVRSILRRIYSFDCFEGNGVPLMEIGEDIPIISSQEVRFVAVPRYSSTMQGKMQLRGIIGEVTFDCFSEEMLLIFLAGEKLHIGKNTSFGFGKYIIK